MEHFAEKKNVTELIPPQITGKSVDLSYSETFEHRDDATACFRNARLRLFNPETWHSITGVFSATFYMQEAEGTNPHRLTQVNDYLKIDIPGPGPMAGNGYDWVQVKAIADEQNDDAGREHAGMKVSPCSDPTNGNNGTAHFFTSMASSTFIVVRDGNMVTSYYHGRNETPNVKTDKALDNIRNAIVASGAIASLSEAQWMSLIKGLLKAE